MNPQVWDLETKSDIFYKQLTSKDLEETISMMEHSFLQYETICKAFGITNNVQAKKEARQIFRIAAKDGISIVAIDKNTKQIVGAALNSYKLKSKPLMVEEIAPLFTQDSCLAALSFAVKLQSFCNLYDLCDVDCIAEIHYVGVLPIYTRKGIAKRLCEISVELIKQLAHGNNVRLPIDNEQLPLPTVPKIVSSIFTSVATQKIGRHLNFQIAAEMRMEDAKFGDRSFAEIIGLEPPTIKIEYKNLI